MYPRGCILCTILFNEENMKYYNQHQRKQEKNETGIIVYARDGEPIDSLIKRFKKKVNKSGIMLDLKDKMFYESKGQRKRRKSKLARLRTDKDYNVFDENTERGD